MFTQFNPQTNHTPGVDVIPAGTLAFAHVSVASIQLSQNTGGENAKLELTLTSGPYAGRKLWHYLGNPTDPKNSEKYQAMSLGALQSMLEAAGIFNPADPATYQRYANASFSAVLQDLDGKTVAIKTKVDKSPGYDDKAVVGDFLSPNPSSRSFKKFQELLSSGGGAPAPAPTAPAFAAPQAAAPAPAPAAGVPAWLAQK